ncbi:hypothetical protein CAPTEDRAFT_133374, partial [Capitella teleta]
GMAGLIVGHPFDTTKVQLQTQHGSSSYKGTWDAVMSINKQGWSKGFFRGMGFPLVSYGVVNSVFFGVYGQTLKFFKGADHERGVTYTEVFLAGSMGGLVQISVACPVDLVKVVLQSQIPKGAVRFKGPVQTIRSILKHRGILGMYHGTSSMVYRDAPTFGVYTVSYEFIFNQMTQRRIGDQHGVVASLVSGGMTGVITWVLAIPWDNVKSLIQADPSQTCFKSNWDCVKYIYEHRGVRGFFTGLGVCCLRAFPVNAVTFLVYSQLLRLLNSQSVSYQ